MRFGRSLVTGLLLAAGVVALDELAMQMRSNTLAVTPRLEALP